MKSFPLKIVILYSNSKFTPWKENINSQTIISLTQKLFLRYLVVITHFNCMDDCFASFLKSFDLVFNVCYGFDSYSQTDITEWSDENEIHHTSSALNLNALRRIKVYYPYYIQK